MLAEKVGTRPIILGSGQIVWKLGKWCFVHERRVVTANDKRLATDMPRKQSAAVPLLDSVVFILDF